MLEGHGGTPLKPKRVTYTRRAARAGDLTLLYTNLKISPPCATIMLARFLRQSSPSEVPPGIVKWIFRENSPPLPIPDSSHFCENLFMGAF